MKPQQRTCAPTAHTPPYCEVVYINKQVHCATVTTPNSAYYEKARYLTEQEKSTYMKPKEGMVLVHIPSRCKTVAAYRVVGYDSHLHVQCRVYEQKKEEIADTAPMELVTEPHNSNKCYYIMI